MSLLSSLIIAVLSLGITEIYAQGVNVPRQNNLNQSQQELIDLFFAAAKTGNNEVVQEFLSHGFPVDIKNKAGYTALMMATYYGHQPVVTTLLKYGSNRCLRDAKGHTALMGAIVKAEWSIAKQLRKVDCDVQSKRTGQLTAEEFAKQFGQEEKLKKLYK
ncbi:ankyrin repeat domain-containing protein [Acinetobacter stercoris]|nr:MULTISPECIES: ankyrin repeat domain-containing protein [Acinetobacter]